MKQFLLTILMVLSLTVNAGVKHDTCFPQNNRINPIGMKASGGLSQAQFEKAIAEVGAVYAPIFKETYKADLVIENHWDDNTVNAYAFQEGDQWHVAMFGGLARDPLVTVDGFKAVICHEIGHHIGGLAKYPGGWASDEGQADYFATAKCLKKVFEKDIQKTVEIYSADEGLSPEQKIAKKTCDTTYANEAEAAMCLRSSLAGESLAKLLGSLGGSSNVKFSTPDPKKVARTNHNHPQAQCRLDTYFQGSLCDKDHMIFPSDSDASVGYCTSKDAYKIGLRPLCWFQPKEYGLER